MRPYKRGIDLFGRWVQWSNGRKPLGQVIHTFQHRNQSWAVVEKPGEVVHLIVVLLTEKLIVLD